MNYQNWLANQKQIYPNQVLSDITATESCHPVNGTWRKDSQHLKSRYWWGGGASQEGFEQLETGISNDLTCIAVITFSPVQLFLGGGNRLRDWAVGSWLCHYLTAAIIYRWETELKGKVLLPLTSKCELLDWMFDKKKSYNLDRFWQASLPNVITGLLPAQDNWQEISQTIVVDEWMKFIHRLENAVVHDNDYNRLFYGVGWQVIKKDSKHLWSIYGAIESHDWKNINQTVAKTHQNIEAAKQARKWEKLWWGGRTSPTAGQLSIWHQGLKPIDTKNNQGLWGLPESVIEQWCTAIAQRKNNKLAGVFSNNDRLNSIEMVKRLASVPELIDRTLELIWHKKAPKCPWKKFPDRSAASASWIIKTIDTELWNQKLRKWKQEIGDQFRHTGWGIKGVDQYDEPPYLHPSILERRNIYEGSKPTNAEKRKLEQWRKIIPTDWACTVEWTVGWRGDGDRIGSWLSGEEYKIKNLDWSKWHPSSQAVTQQNLNPQIRERTPRQLDIPHLLDLCVLFEKWNELLYQLTEEIYLGRVIFAGGDDFLLLGSLSDAIGLTSNLYRLWTGVDTVITKATESEGWVKRIKDLNQKEEEIYPVPGKLMTFSLGIVIAQRRIPQSLWHRGLEQAYKEAKYAGRNRVCVKVLFNSGQSFNWICPWNLWEKLMSNYSDLTLNHWEKLQMYLQSTSVDKQKHPVIGKMLEKLWQSVGLAWTWSEIKQIGSGTPEISSWQWWQTWVSLRCFLVRQQRERDKWKQKIPHKANLLSQEGNKS